MKQSAKGAKILVDDAAGAPQDISVDCDSFDIGDDIDAVEITGFVEGVKNYTPGLKVKTIKIDVIWNTAATTGSFTVLQGILGSATSKTVAITPEGAGKTFSGEFMLKGISPAGKPGGAIQLGSCEFAVMGATAPAWA